NRAVRTLEPQVLAIRPALSGRAGTRHFVCNFTAASVHPQRTIVRFPTYTKEMKWKTLALAAGLSPLAGCMISSIPTGPTQYESHATEPDKSNLLDVNLTMGAGDLKVGSGTQKFMQGYFTYNVPAFKPDIRYSNSGTVGNLTIEQPGKVHSHTG